VLLALVLRPIGMLPVVRRVADVVVVRSMLRGGDIEYAFPVVVIVVWESAWFARRSENIVLASCMYILVRELHLAREGMT